MTSTRIIGTLFFFSIWLSCMDKSPDYPSIFLVKKKTEGFTSIEDLKYLNQEGHQGRLWSDFMKKLDQDFQVPHLDPSTDFPGRDPIQLKHANVSYDMARGVCERMARSCLMFLITENEKYKDLVMDQIKALFDEELWPMWCDKAHVRSEGPQVDIRTFRISMWVALCFNWMHSYLSEEEKVSIIEGLDRRAIQPFWQRLAQRPSWYVHRHNWFTNMFGGMGITAMALGDYHPETQRILDTIVPEMIDFHNIIGDQGEFNEPPGYAGAVRFSVEFAEALRYFTKNQVNLLKEKPFPQLCYWMMYHTLPPGRLTAFGDTPVNKSLSFPAVIAAVANAADDRTLQWYYLENFVKMTSPMELLWFNPDVGTESPDGKLPLGRAYSAYGADFISRTSWDPEITACVVYGKVGRETNHDDNDVGQILIDGFGERLIIDPGKPDPIYPKDYFGKSQYQYYTRSSKGHNVIVIDNQEMISEPNSIARGETIRSWFNDSIGSSWAWELTPVYKNAHRVTRKVAHLFPAVIVVHDEVVLPTKSDIDLRWHTFSPPVINESGNFYAKNNQAAIVAKVISLDQRTLSFSTGNHEFKSPYHLTRQGDPLIQHYEPFVKISTEGNQCSILSLFAVVENKGDLPIWEKTDTGWKLTSQDETFKIDRLPTSLRIHSLKTGRSILME